MAGNTFGQLFRVTTFGESHGLALGAIVDGCPPGMALTEADLQGDLDRRKPGTSRFTTQRREDDEVKILSGVFEGKTTGTSIGLLIENTDQRSKDYSDIKDVFRPGHADYTYHQKYGIRDYRGGGRSSARETAMRVAAGAIAKKYLKEHCGIEIFGYLDQLGPIKAERFDKSIIETNPFFFADPDKLDELDAFMRDLKKQGDSIGAKLKVVATCVPVGLGEPVFDRLDADIAHAMMGINAVKGVEVGWIQRQIFLQTARQIRVGNECLTKCHRISIARFQDVLCALCIEVFISDEKAAECLFYRGADAVITDGFAGKNKRDIALA